MDIRVDVVNQRLQTATNLTSFIAGTQEFIRFVFNLDNDWANLLVFAQFTQNETSYNQYLDSENSAYLPAEIVAGTCTLTLYGSYENKKATTNYLVLEIEENNLNGIEPTPTPTEDGSVRFVDYNGTVVKSYTPEQFANLTALPANPSHEGLTAQGWNYTLSDAQAYVAVNGALDIGQTYITDDGRTRLHIRLEESRLKPQLGLAINGSVVVDWGDDSATDTMTGTSLTTAVYQEHQYAAAGEYTISIAVTGEIAFIGDSTNGAQILSKASGDKNTNKVYLKSIRAIEIGSGISSIGDCALQSCTAMTDIIMPTNITSIGSYGFQECYSLTNVTIPSGVTGIGSGAFQNCYSLANVTISDGITDINSSVFYGCSALAVITIPDSVTNIGASAFQNCSSLTDITIPSGVTNIGGHAFANCYSLVKMVIPNSVTTMGSPVFPSCYALTSCMLSDHMTSIGNNTFQGCSGLANITIPSSITSIGSNAFNGCYGLGFIKFESSTPPTVSSVNAWTNVPNDCIIYVPTGSLSTYTGNNKYPSSSTYTYTEY